MEVEGQACKGEEDANCAQQRENHCQAHRDGHILLLRDSIIWDASYGEYSMRQFAELK